MLTRCFESAERNKKTQLIAVRSMRNGNSCNSEWKEIIIKVVK